MQPQRSSAVSGVVTRRPRAIGEGTWHHVYNRAIARRPLFEGRRDIRYFLACLARAVRRREIEVHAFCVLTTHYHLLVRCPTGKLAQAMRRVQTEYSRSFNRLRRRDGPLVRGRYGSRLVEDDDYQHLLVGYIDANPVRAGLCTQPWTYAFGSARFHVSGRGAPWLDRTWVGSVAEGLVPYARVFHGILLSAGSSPASAPEEAQDLVAAVPERVRDWMIAKAKLADGTRPGTPFATRTSVEVSVRSTSSAGELVQCTRKRRPLDQLLLVALRRDLCGEPFARIADSLGISERTAGTIYRQHQELVLNDGAYAERVRKAVARALANPSVRCQAPY